MAIKHMNSSLLPMSNGSHKPSDGVVVDESNGPEFFIKVAVMLLIQLAGTGWVIALFKVTATRLSLNDAIYVYYLLLLICGVALSPFLCWREIRQAVPYNYLILAALTLLFALGSGPFVMSIPGISLIGAMMSSVALLLCTWLVAIGLNFDFTIPGVIIAIITICWFTAWIALLVIGIEKETFVVGSGVNLLVFCLVLLADSQTMLGRRESTILSNNEYILGSLFLYCDCMAIFGNFCVVFVAMFIGSE